MRTIALIASLLLSLLPGLGSAQDTAASSMPRTPAPAGATVYIVSPADRDRVSSPVTVRFGLRGMGVAPAGVEAPNTGHHHLLINVTEPPALDQPLPANDQIRHFGAGQTETTLELTPGDYTLQLVLGDHLHIPHQPPTRSPIVRITVTE